MSVQIDVAPNHTYAGRHVCNVYCNERQHAALFYFVPAATREDIKRLYSGTYRDPFFGVMRLHGVWEAPEALPVLEYNRQNGYLIHELTHTYTKAFMAIWDVLEPPTVDS